MTTSAHEPLALPSGLRERVIAASRRARSAGTSLPEAPEITPGEAFSRAADAFSDLLDGLASSDWHRPALRGLDVQELVGHLIGVEHDMHRCLTGDPEVAGTDHVQATQPAAVRQAGCATSRTHAQWRRATDRTIELVTLAADPQAQVALHGMRLTLGALLVARAFELWTHENDIRVATGRPSSVPDLSTLHVMTGLAMRLLPAAVAHTGFRAPTMARLVLTGPGGGTWDLLLGDQAIDPVPVHIVTDAVEFCRLAANRVSAAELDPHVTGDPSRASGILAAVSTLALD
jgi:uncharacterized protein (TIGR03083 family)